MNNYKLSGTPVMHAQQQRIFTSIIYFLVGLLIQIWSSFAFADPDIVAQSYASAQSPGIQSCTKGYGFLSGDVGYQKTLIQGQLPYVLSYRAPLRENLSSALVMESQEESTSGWTDNYQNYVRTISYSYTKTLYNTVTQTGSTLTASSPTTVNTYGTLYFVKLPGDSEEAVFKNEQVGNTITTTRLYSADPAGDITNLNLSKGTIDSLPWSTDLGEYTITLPSFLFGGSLTFTKYGATYIFGSGSYTIAAGPAYTDKYYGYLNAAGWQQVGPIKNTTYTPPADATTNAVVIGVVDVGTQTTTIQRIAKANYPNGKSLGFTYDNNLNLTKVTDNRNNILTFQHNYTQALLLANQTVHESRAITQVSLSSGNLGDVQTATMGYSAYNVYEPSSGNAVTVYSLASSNSPISGSYTYTNTMTQIGSIPAYVRNFQTGFNATTTPDSNYYFPVLTQVTNALGQIEQKWNVTQNYVVKFNAATTTAPSYYSYSTAKTILESYRPGGNGVAAAMDMTTTYDDIVQTINMSFNPWIGGSGRPGNVSVATAATTTSNTSTTGVSNNTSTVTLTVTGNYPCISVGGKPMSSAAFDTLHSRMLSSKDSNGNTTTYTYDPISRLSSVIDPLGHVTSYTYTTLNTGAVNTTSTPNTVTAPQISVTNVLNSRGQILTQTKSYPQSGSSTQVVSYTYGTGTSLGLVATSTGSRTDVNDTTTYTYDPFGNLAVKSSAVINASTGAQTNYQTVYHSYNSAGIPLSVSNADGSLDTVTLDAGYRTLQTVHTSGSASQTTSTTYDTLGRPITSTDADGKVTSYAYDAIGRLTKTIYPNGTSEQDNYHPNGVSYEKAQLSATGAVVASSWQDVDGTGRVIYTRLGGGNSLWTSIAYDANGNVTMTQTPTIVNTWTYDALNRVTSHKDGNGSVDTKSYDDASNNSNEAAANNAGSGRGFINHDVLLQEQNTDFGTKSYSYDLDNHMTARQHVDRRCNFGTIDQLGRPQFNSKPPAAPS
jgi:YD repeat-containing protein